MRALLGAAFASLLVLASAFPASAAEGLVVASPASWRLQNYIGNGVTVYYTGVSTCPSGGLTFGSGATIDDINRFWTLILTAKATGAQVGVYYDNVTCLISSFYATP